MTFVPARHHSVLTPSSAANPLRSWSFYISSEGAPPATTWLKLETIDGPNFSGLPLWFAHDPTRNTLSDMPFLSLCERHRTFVR